MRYVNPRTQHADVPTPLTTHHSLLTAQKPVLMFICLISKEICGHLSHLRNLCAIVKRRTLTNVGTLRAASEVFTHANPANPAKDLEQYFVRA